MFRVKVPEQTDHISCGYYILRNMIGISVCKDKVFPILVKDFTGGDRTCDKYNAYFAKVSPTYNHLKDKITRKKTMRYSAQSPEIDLRPQIMTSFVRLATIHGQFENKAMEIDSMGGYKYKIGSTILSMVVLSSENNTNQPHQTVIANNTKLKKYVLKEFVIIYGTPKAFKKTGKCVYPPMIKAPYLENDPHRLPNYTYVCFRTKTKGCGLGVTNKMMSKTKFNNLQVHDKQYFPL